jgi:hypothetical protein
MERILKCKKVRELKIQRQPSSLKLLFGKYLYKAKGSKPQNYPPRKN